MGGRFRLLVRPYSTLQSVTTKRCKGNATRTFSGGSASFGCCANGALLREMRGVLCDEEVLEAGGTGGAGTRRVTTIDGGFL